MWYVRNVQLFPNLTLKEFNEPVTFGRCALTPCTILHLAPPEGPKGMMYIVDMAALISLEELASLAIIIEEEE